MILPTFTKFAAPKAGFRKSRTQTLEKYFFIFFKIYIITLKMNGVLPQSRGELKKFILFCDFIILYFNIFYIYLYNNIVKK
jgi:hypothetical protein